MTSNAARISAIISAILTLLCVGIWLANGAPNVPVVNLMSQAADAYWSNAELTWARWMIWGIAATATWASRTALFILAASVATAAILSLATLLRGSHSVAIRYLGVSLGWWSLSIAYLWVFSVVPTFEAFQRTPILLRFAADAAAFGLLLAATFTFALFWREFPRPVSDGELRVFISALTREKYEVLGPIRKKYYQLVKRVRPIKEGEVQENTTPPRLLHAKASSRTVKMIIVTAIVLWCSMGWRGFTIIDPDTAVTNPVNPYLLVYIIVLWALLCAYMIPFNHMLRPASVDPRNEASRMKDIGRFKQVRTVVRVGCAVAILGFLTWFFNLFLTGFICFFVVLYWPGVLCARLFRFHRAQGSADDRRKIEWIWAALWTALVIFLIPVVVAPVLAIASHWFPELSFELGWIGIYMILAWMSGPLILTSALALSIFYRGTIDPRLALRSVTVWTLLGIVLTLLFVFVERSIAQRAVTLLHLPPQTSLVTAGAVVAATFQPIRSRSEKAVNRFVERVLPTTMLASGTRRAAAVAVVDISSYTALSEKDEQSALLASALVQKQARRVADKHDGRVVKSTGDGVIMAFAAAQQAFEAIRELHISIATGAEALNLSDLKLHSALHWGEIVEMHDGDIYGQTVNIAARIADWAKAGEIGASQAFWEQLAPGTKGFEITGPQTFKNIQLPISCLKMVTG